jgi:hypothetical protein
MRSFALLAPLLLLGASAGLVARHDAAVAPAARTPPASLSATLLGSTTLGLSGTLATTTYTPAIVPVELLALSGGPSTWSVRAQFVSYTGGGALDTTRLRLCDPPAACLLQVVITGTTPTQTTGSPITLDPSETDVRVQLEATKVSIGPAVLVVHLVFSGPGVSYAYRYTLNLV